jgi:regulator of sirC expression with transglutaminase-like and TPR domain
MRAIVVGIFLLLQSSFAFADEASYSKMTPDVKALFHMRGDFVDLKIAIDKIVDPNVDAVATRAKFDAFAAPLEELLQGVQSDHERLKVLRQFLFTAGAWNQNHPLRYDFDDPFAKIGDHRFLTYTLKGRLGNRVTMPTLMMLLGKRVDLNMTLLLLPRHAFVKFRDEQNRIWNLEATSGGGYTRDSHYREQFKFSQKAVDSGVYKRALTDEKAIALLAQFIPEWLMQHDKQEDAIAAYDIILKHFPNDAFAWVGRGSSFALILRRDFVSKFKSFDEMTPDQRQSAEFLSAMNKHNFDQAEALGWTEQDDLKSEIEKTTFVRKQE